MQKTSPDAIRLKYRYRKLILDGKIKLPFKDAVKLVGRDTAYHLYFSHTADKPETENKKVEND